MLFGVKAGQGASEEHRKVELKIETKTRNSNEQGHCVIFRQRSGEILSRTNNFFIFYNQTQCFRWKRFPKSFLV